jgi:hypothetical protein
VHLVEQLMKTSESAEAELSTARLKPGIYFIEISVGKHKIVRKLVKE